MSELKKKHIIISDPSLALNLLTNDAKNNQINLLSGLLQQGFAISAWTSEGLQRITNKTDLMPTLKKIVPVHPMDLIKNLAEQGMASKECYLMGMQQTIELLKRLQLLSDVIDTNQLINLPNEVLDTLLNNLSSPLTIDLEIEEDNLLSLVSEPKEKILLKHLECNPALLSFTTEIRNQENSQHPLELFKKLSFLKQNVQLSTLLTSKYLEKLTLNKCSLDETQDNLPLCKTLKDIQLHNVKTSWYHLSQVINASSSLESLYIDQNEKFDKFQAFSSTSIKTLKLFDSYMDWQQLLQLITSCPSLENLILSTTWPMDYELLRKCPLSSTKLKKISLEDLDHITWEQLSQLLKFCPSLEELILINCNHLNELPENLPLSLPALKKITINNFRESTCWQPLLQLTKLCPSIEELHYTSYNELPNELFFSFPTLKKIKLTGRITWQQVSKWVKSCPSLEELDLSHCKNLGELPENLTFLSHIKIINLRNKASIKRQSYNQIITSFPNMIVDGCALFDTPYNINDIRDTANFLNKTRENSINEAKLDSDTGISNKQLYGRQVFEKITPGNYRCQIFQDITINRESVKLIKTAPVLKHCELLSPRIGVESYTGCFEVKKDSWTALPSLTTHDQLISIQTHPEVELEIAFNDQEQLYYIKPKKPLNRSIIVSYTIEADYSKQRTVSPEILNEAIHDQIAQLTFDVNGLLQKNTAFYQFNNLTEDQKSRALITYLISVSPKNHHSNTKELNY